MQNYPIFINLTQQPCLVVGGGPVALRKIRLMRSAGAEITVVAPALCTELTEEFGAEITHLARPFEASDIHGYRLITAATNIPSVNRLVSELAQQANIPVNVVDQPELCSFITPSIVDRSPVLIAISTGGDAPVLARMLRTRLETFIPASYGTLAAAMGRFRDKLKGVVHSERERRRFWERVIQGPIAELFFSGREDQAEAQLEAAIDALNDPKHTSEGEVWLIGAGPGDPDLLTFRALRLMQQADVVLYDRLVSPAILNLTRRDADRIYVGKARSDHAVPQSEINQLLVDLAKQGKSVVRLKGGDPFIFGRGGEEIALLAQSGVPFQIVPGITAASGCATYAGIPLTHRDHSQSCLFVTGHLKNGSVDLNWPLLATPNQTVVVYMGLVGLPIICQQLILHGVSEDMPIALIEQGTTSSQKVYTGTLATMAGIIEGQSVKAPTLIIIGTVVSLRDQLAWFDGGDDASIFAKTTSD
ncbi:siroheme synthase CysG [Arenicella xantha]|uniref:Siroheme synthase n=1 Tax=Arenicella xantha TaxID=644221 RepID=A0A395JKX7_9GAMM|nr:siroheme synthase CysG [Arenicella xantha]RBP49841.1 uroporphyrinogen-III C-methyltransferase /precorrin-2 dehydrogenase [Arenicella xantha]